MGLRTSRRTYLALIAGCANASRSDSAYNLYRSREAGCTASARPRAALALLAARSLLVLATCNAALISGLGRLASPFTCFCLGGAVRAQGMEADGATASALIISLCQANQVGSGAAQR